MNGKELSTAIGIITSLLVFCVFTSSAFNPSEGTDYTYVKKLGHGHHGRTWLLKNESDNTSYVLKKARLNSGTEDPSVKREIHFGKKFKKAKSHIGKDHVSRFIKSVKVDNSVRLVTLFEGSPLKELLFQFNVTNKKFEPTAWLTWLRNTTEGHQVMKSLFYQMLLGVKFCHDNDVIHRDIKLGNIVICFEKSSGSCGAAEPLYKHTDDIHLRLIDFGIAVDSHTRRNFYGKDGPSGQDQNMTTVPPETIVDPTWRKFPLSPKYDSWNVGLVIMEFILGTSNVLDFQYTVSDELLNHDHSINRHHTTHTIAMAEMCIGLPQLVKIKEMKKRATCTEDGFADYVRSRDTCDLGFHDVELLKLVRLLMRADPDLRIGVDEALQHPYFVGFTYTIVYNYFTFLTFAVLLGSIWYGFTFEICSVIMILGSIWYGVNAVLLGGIRYGLIAVLLGGIWYGLTLESCCAVVILGLFIDSYNYWVAFGTGALFKVAVWL